MHAAGDDEGVIGGRALAGAAPAGAYVAYWIPDAGCRSTKSHTHAHASRPSRATQHQAKSRAGLPRSKRSPAAGNGRTTTVRLRRFRRAKFDPALSLRLRLECAFAVAPFPSRSCDEYFYVPGERSAFH
jgi:hypothetical protein